MLHEDFAQVVQQGWS
jgi:hypothetical protein